MKKLKCAVIGAGWWGTTAHVPALKQHPRAELIAIQTRDRDQARKIAADFGVPHGCTTIEEVLAIDGLRAVAISSTPHLHYAQAKACLERGLHVLIEKPMTFTVREAQELVDLAAKRNLQFVISCPWHYTTHSIEARKLVQSGALGRLKMISVLMTNFTMGLYRGLPWDKVFATNPALQNAEKPYIAPGQSSYNDPAISGGGQIYCQVSHASAYLGFLTGRQPSEVFARFDNADTPVDIYDSLNIKLDDGTLVSMASTGATMLSKRHYEVRVYGTGGMLLLELWQGKMEFHDLHCNVRTYPDISEPEAHSQTSLPEAGLYPMFAPVSNLVDAALGLAPNGSPATLGLFAMKITEAACQSVKTGANVKLR